MTQSNRPVSPHIQIYKWRYTLFSSSVWNRGTGIVLSLGIFPLIYWLAAMAAGKQTYAHAMIMLTTPAAKLFIFGSLFAFYFHLFNGIRHLGWDIGVGFERSVSRLTGRLVFFATIAFTLITWW